MRKYIFLCISFFIFLTACSSKNEEKKFYLNGSGNEIEVTYYLKDGIATGQETRTKLLYKNLDAKDENDAKKIMASFSESYKEVNGLKHEVEYKDDHLIEKSKVEYQKLDKDTLTELGLTFGNVDKEMSISEITKSMKEIGFSETKKSSGEILNDELEDEMNLYNELTKDFEKTSVEELKNIKDKYLLYVGFQECPYCRIFVPKLHMANIENEQKIYYLDTKTLKDTTEEKEFIKKLSLETVPAVYVIEKEKVINFKFESSEDVEIEEISTFINENF